MIILMKNNHAFVCKAVLLITVLIFFFANFGIKWGHPILLLSSKKQKK
jgi:hypothetical protein